MWVKKNEGVRLWKGVCWQSMVFIFFILVKIEIGSEANLDRK